MLFEKLVYWFSAVGWVQKISYRYEFRIQTKHTWKTIQTLRLLELTSIGDCFAKVHKNWEKWYWIKHGICKWRSCFCKTFERKSKAK